jgi:hypothetical protein
LKYNDGVSERSSTQQRWQCFQLGWELFQFLNATTGPLLFDPLIGSISARVKLLGLELDCSRLEALKQLPVAEIVAAIPNLKAFFGNQIQATSTLQSVYAFSLGFDLGMSVVVHANIVIGVTGEFQNVEHVQNSIAEEVDKIDIDPELVKPVLQTLGDASISADAFAEKILRLSGQLAEILERPPSHAKVFVVMSFSEANRQTYDTIKNAARLTGYFAWRSDDKVQEGRIIDEVFRKGIAEAAIVVVDLTESRPNVYLELGLAQGQTKNTILLAKAGTVLPFDTNHLETIYFDTQQDLESKLKDHFKKHSEMEASKREGADPTHSQDTDMRRIS